MSSVRVLASVAGLSLDAIRTETALRHGLHWCRDQAAATVAFLDSHHLWDTCRHGENALQAGELRSVDLILPADRWAAQALRRHGGLLAEATDPSGFCLTMLAALASHQAAVGLVCPSLPLAEAISHSIRSRFPLLRLPATRILESTEEDPWTVGAIPPADLEDLRSVDTCLTLFVGPGRRPPIHSALALAQGTRQVVIALGLNQVRGLPSKRASFPWNTEEPGWLERMRAGFWARFLA